MAECEQCNWNGRYWSFHHALDPTLPTIYMLETQSTLKYRYCSFPRIISIKFQVVNDPNSTKFDIRDNLIRCDLKTSKNVPWADLIKHFSLSVVSPTKNVSILQAMRDLPIVIYKFFCIQLFWDTHRQYSMLFKYRDMQICSLKGKFNELGNFCEF